ncbi:helix-turn-helix domain-containing protein [Deinococcus sp. Leaf326]|uniref:helix-turn-helix domain-containing protein n=1 Tax=Deinococcus sp. Leaf326 TaxID=1736338 RepID=UPI0009E81F1D|nr:helix-turn-helix domain-containing protein [Deinococcus sp. Leaf326]
MDKMNKTVPTRKPSIERAVVNHPGSIIAFELDARGWTQKDLAAIVQRPAQAINEIINGKKRITAETAYALASALGINEEIWLRLESNYQLYISRQNVKQHEIARRSALFSFAPILEMIRRGWLKNIDNKTETLESSIEEFYGSKIPQLSPYLPQLRFRLSENRTPEEYAKLAWVIQVYHLAKKDKVAQFNLNNLDKLIEDLLELTKHPKQVTMVKPKLEEYGIHFILLEHLSKSYIDGATFYLDDNPVVALTLRFDRLDYFWFTLMHELAHIKLGHTEGHIDDSLESNDTTKDEIEASEVAGNWLIEESKLEKFLTDSRNLDKATIDLFAESILRHPSIVIGRLHNRKILSYSKMRDHIPKVKHFLPME